MTPAEREILTRAAQSQCLRCEMQGEPEYDASGDHTVEHTAYTTNQGTGIPAEPCASAAIWRAMTEIDSLNERDE